MPTAAAIANIASGVIGGALAKDAGDKNAKAQLEAAGLVASGYLKSAEVTSDAAIRAAKIQANTEMKAAAAQKKAGIQGRTELQAGGTRAIDALRTGETGGEAAINAGTTAAKGAVEPWLKTGTAATYSLADLYGLPTPKNPNGGQPLSDDALEAFRRSPDYQFALKEGIRSVDASAAAKGGLLSGGTLKGVETFGSGLASQNLGNYMQRLQAISELGERAGEYTGNLDTSGATELANLRAGLGKDIANVEGTTSRGVSNVDLAMGDARAAALRARSAFTAGGIRDAAKAKAIGLTGAAGAYSQGVIGSTQAGTDANISAFNNIAGGVGDAFNQFSMMKYLNDNAKNAGTGTSTGYGSGGML